MLYNPMQMTLAAEIADRALITEPTVRVAKARSRHQWLARRHRGNVGSTSVDPQMRRRILLHSTVSLKHSIVKGGRRSPEGATGSVVHAYGDGEHYEVEFSQPFHCVVTVGREDIGLARAK